MHDAEHKLFLAARQLEEAAEACREQATSEGRHAEAWSLLTLTARRLSELTESLASQSHDLEWEQPREP